MTSRTKARDLNAAQRSKLALQLRTEGKSLADIALLCDYKDASGAHYAIKRALAALPQEDALTLRRIESMHLEQLRAAILPLVQSGENKDEDEDEDKPRKKKKPSLFAIDRLIMISKRYSEVTGLDAKPDEEITNQNYTKKIILTHSVEVQQ